VPPIPTVSPGTPGPSSPPVVWIGGQVTAITQRTVEVEESSGAVVLLQRLGAGATRFFRVSRGEWNAVEPGTGPHGEPACAEVLMDGDTLLALRVFLGSTCGPT
jgi:RNase P/RNase MRP subunit p29